MDRLDEVVGYIKKSKEMGSKEKEIRANLANAGWKEKDINDAFIIFKGEQLREVEAKVPMIAPKKEIQEKSLIEIKNEVEDEKTLKEYIEKTNTKNRPGMDPVEHFIWWMKNAFDSGTAFRETKEFQISESILEIVYYMLFILLLNFFIGSAGILVLLSAAKAEPGTIASAFFNLPAGLVFIPLQIVFGVIAVLLKARITNLFAVLLGGKGSYGRMLTNNVIVMSGAGLVLSIVASIATLLYAATVGNFASQILISVICLANIVYYVYVDVQGIRNAHGFGFIRSFIAWIATLIGLLAIWFVVALAVALVFGVAMFGTKIM